MYKISTKVVRSVKIAIAILVFAYILILTGMELGMEFFNPVFIAIAPLFSILSLFQDKPELKDRSRLGFSDHIVEYYLGGVQSVLFLGMFLVYQGKVIFGSTWYSLAFFFGLLISLIALMDMFVQIFKQIKWQKSHSK